MKILITGAGGFVAPYAAQAFAARVPDVEIVASSHRGGTASGFEQTLALDVADPAAIAAVLERVRPTHVLHLAGVAAPQQAGADPDAAWRINVFGALALGRAILRGSPQTILLNAGSGSAYGDSANRFDALDENAPFAPADEYGATKAAADLGLGAMAKCGLKLVRMRPFNHTGPGQIEDYVAPAFAAQIAAVEAGGREPVLKVGNLEAERDFCDVRDVADAYALAALAASEGRLVPARAFNLCSGRALRMRALLDMLLAMSRVSVAVEPDPARMRASEIPRMVGDPRRAEAELGWRATIGVETTLRDLLEHERARIAATEG
jgi:GDP-4-dehydro-6-deoxy-D-mannose reductase